MTEPTFLLQLWNTKADILLVGVLSDVVMILPPPLAPPVSLSRHFNCKGNLTHIHISSCTRLSATESSSYEERKYEICKIQESNKYLHRMEFSS